MIIHLRNRYELSLREAVERAKADGGDISHISIAPLEAAGILREIKHNGALAYGRFQIKVNAKGPRAADPRFILAGKDEEFERRLVDLVRDWHAGHFEVTWDSVPLKVINPRSRAPGRPQQEPSEQNQPPS